MRVQAGARGGPAERDLPQPRQRIRNAIAPLPDLRGVAGELLAQRHRDGVHQVRASGLDDVTERDGFDLEGLRQVLECRYQPLRRCLERRQMYRRGEYVVGTLPHVDVVVGVYVGASELRDDLVGVHVGRRA